MDPEYAEQEIRQIIRRFLHSGLEGVEQVEYHLKRAEDLDPKIRKAAGYFARTMRTLARKVLPEII